MSNSLRDNLKANFETLKEIDDPRDLDVLGWEYTVSGTTETVTEITLELTTGGPHISLDLFQGELKGTHGSDTAQSPIFQTDTEAYESLEQLRTLYKELIRA